MTASHPLESMSLTLTHPWYLFGCCAACRAPFVPPLGQVELFEFQETQTVAFLMSRFKKISGDKKVSPSPSEFTAEALDFHMVYQAHIRPGLSFVRGLSAKNLPKDVTSKRYFFLDTKSRKGTGRAPVDEGVSHLRSLWKVPRRNSGVVHSALAEHLNRSRPLLDFAIDLDNVIPCCSLCNDIWDTAARLSRVLRDPSVIPEDQLTVLTGKGKKSSAVRITPLSVTMPNPGVSDATYKSCMGCMACYYVHASVVQMYRACDMDESKFSPEKMDAITMLAWLPMHAHCMYQEMAALATGKPHVKGRHNYLGCLDLILSYFLYVMLRTDPLHARVSFSELPFEKFHVYYAKELPESPEFAWHRLHEAVFGDDYHAAASEAGRVEACSAGLVRLYQSSIAPLVDVMAGDDDHPFFLTRAEADDFDMTSTVFNEDYLSHTRVHLKRAGASAVLWQILRALREENEAYPQEVEKWIKSRMEAEWANMAGQSKGLLEYKDAQYVYAAMHTLQPLRGATKSIEQCSQSEVLDLIRARKSAGRLVEDLKDSGRCSMWKAAHRLKDWSFTVEPEADYNFWRNLKTGGRRAVELADRPADSITELLRGLTLS